MVVRLIVQTLAWFGAMGALLFVAAGTLDWPGAWAFLAVMVSLSLVAGLLLARHDPALLTERLGPLVQKDQVAADKVLMSLIMIGALSLFLSVYIGYRTMRENSFAAPVVKIQKDRGQTVITTGPYSYVRHPMYFGGLFFFIGTPLLLGSWWGS